MYPTLVVGNIIRMKFHDIVVLKKLEVESFIVTCESFDGHLLIGNC